MGTSPIFHREVNGTSMVNQLSMDHFQYVELPDGIFVGICDRRCGFFLNIHGCFDARLGSRMAFGWTIYRHLMDSLNLYFGHDLLMG